MLRGLNRWKRPLKKNIVPIFIGLIVFNALFVFRGGCDEPHVLAKENIVESPASEDTKPSAALIDEMQETIQSQKDELRLKQARIEYLEIQLPKATLAPQVVSKYSQKSQQQSSQPQTSQKPEPKPTSPPVTPTVQKSRQSKKTQAFITLVSDSKYALGALVLFQSLIDSGTTKDFVVLVLENHQVSPVILDLLREKGAIVKEAAEITVPVAVQSNVPRWKLAFSKLRIFDETEYSKVVWVDADDIVLQNIDDLFGYPDISAPPDFNACTQRADRVSSGILVVEPKSDKFWKLYDFLEESDQSSNIRNDQDLINAVFKQKTILPEEYGPFVERCHCENTTPINQAKTAQFNDVKPWDMKWWDTYKNFDASNCRYKYFLEWVKFFERATKKPIESINEFLV